MFRFQRKIPKTQAPDKSPFTSYHFHTVSTENRQWPHIIRVISIDPGIANFCIRVEERPIDFTVKIPPKSLLYVKLKLSKEAQQLTESNECIYYKSLFDFFELHLALFQSCHLVIIERQMPFNYKATRIAQHIITFFMIYLKNLSHLPAIYEIDSKLKTDELGAPKTLNDRGIKQWTPIKAVELLEMRGDTESLSILNKNKKKDDLSDVICQIEGLFSFLGLPLTADTIPLKLNIISKPVSIPNEIKLIKLNITTKK